MLFKKHKHVGGYIGSSIIPESSFISSSASGTYSSNEINVFKKRSKWPLFGEADTYFSNVVLLLAADGTNGSVVLNDSSSYNHTINIVGNAELRTDIKKFGLSSLYIFGGSANIASLSSNNWNFNTNDFTIECWIYPTAGIGASRDILSKFTTLSSNLDFLLEIDSANGNLKFSAGNNATISILSNSAVPLNVWSHVAISRVSGVTRMFIDGALQSSTSTGSFSIPNNTTTLTIGKSSTNSDPFSGYIDEIRITRNVGRYSSSFSIYNGRFSNFGLDPTTPGVPTGLSSLSGDSRLVLNWIEPSNNGGSSITGYVVEYTPSGGSPTTVNTGSSSASYLLTGLTNGTTYTFRVAAVNSIGTGSYSTASSAVSPTVGDLLFGNVQLLIPGDTSTNDFSSYSRSVTANGGAASSASQSRWGGGSISFNGSGQYLTVADNAALELGGSDFAIELWLRTTQTTAYATLVSRGSGDFGSGSWSLMLNASGAGSIALYASDFSSSVPMLLTSGVSVTDGAWHHVAWVRNGTQHSLYVDGTRYANVTSSIIISDISSSLAIGTDLVYSGRDFSGFIDDLRYTVGQSRYNGSTITVPTAAFNTFGPMLAPTSLSATGGNAQISLTWTAPSYNGGSTITGYVIEYTPAGGSASTVNTNSTNTSYNITGLVNDVNYTIKVAAINAFGTGTYSLTTTSAPTTIVGPLLSFAAGYQGGPPLPSGNASENSYSLSGLGTNSGSPTTLILGGGDNCHNQVWLQTARAGTLNYTITVSSENNYDYGSLYKSSGPPSYNPSRTGFTTIVSPLAGINQTASGTLFVTQGEFLILIYTKDDSADDGTDTVTFSGYIT